MLHTIAHAGHTHEEMPADTAPVITEAGIAIALIIGLGIFWLLTSYVVRIKFTNRVFVTLLVMLVAGVAGYQAAPIISTVALAAGFGLTCAVVFLPFMLARRS